MLGLEDPSARTTALRSDAVDCIQKVELKTASRLKLPGVNVIATTGNKQITMRTDMAPYDNNHVRMALKVVSFQRNISRLE